MKRPGSTWYLTASLSLLTALAVACSSSDPVMDDAGAGGDPQETTAPQILSFAASPSSLTSPGPVEISWATSNAVSITLSQDGDSIDLSDALPEDGSVEVMVDQDSTFELVAIGSGGDSVTETLRVFLSEEPLPEAPTIASFTAPEVVGLDEEGRASATLSWTGVVHADSLSIETTGSEPISIDLAWTPDGSLDVEVEGDTTFSLVAINQAGEARAEVSIRAVAFPSIGGFTADREWVGISDPVLLEWITADTSRVELWVDDALLEVQEPLPLSGSFSFIAIADSSIELRAFNELDTMVHDSFSLKVAPPELISLTGNEESLWLGETLNLAWATRGGRSLTVRVEGMEEPICERQDFVEFDEGTCEWEPLAVGTYELILEVTNGSGVASKAWSLVVGSGPAIRSFSITPKEITAGESVMVAWDGLADPDGEFPTVVLLDGAGGSFDLNPEAGTRSITIPEAGQYEFTLRASTSHPLSNHAEATVTITVHAIPSLTLVPSASEFDDSEDEAITLSWTSKDAASLTLYRLTDGDPTQLYQVPTAQLASGSTAITPDRAATYRMVGSNALGFSEYADVTITLAPTKVVLFEANPKEIVEGEPVLLSWKTRTSSERSLDLFDKHYSREEAAEPYLDAEAEGGIHLPYQMTCHSVTSNTKFHGCSRLEFPDGFFFPFDGRLHSHIDLYTHGVTSFQNVLGDGQAYSNTRLPNNGPLALAPFWNLLGWDEARFPVGNFFYLHREEVDRSSLVIQWKSIGNATDLSVSFNFELILWSNGEFEYRYGEMDPGSLASGIANGSAATIGFQAKDLGLSDSIYQIERPLENRGLAYRLSPAIERSGSYVWYPSAVAGQPSISTTLSIANGADQDQGTVSVTVHQRPGIMSLAYPVEPLLTKTDFEIHWTTRAASSIEVLDQDGVKRCETTDPQRVAEGSCVLNEGTEAIHTYRILAKGALNTVVEKEADVTVYDEFGIESFDVSERSIDYRGSVVISWDALNAHHVSLRANGAELLPTGHPSGPGTHTVFDVIENTEFILTITNSVGMTQSDSIEVRVPAITFNVTATPARIQRGQSATIKFEATVLDGGAPPVIFGTLPMVEDTRPASKYIDISTVQDAHRHPISPTSSVFAVYVDLPEGFEFPFFGESNPRFRFFSRGYLSMNAQNPNSKDNVFLPSTNTSFQHLHFAPFWDDIRLQGAGEAWWVLLDPDTYVIQWKRFSTTVGSTVTYPMNLNFQVVLHRSGAFEYRYGAMESFDAAHSSTACFPSSCVNEANGSSATIGYQAPGATAGYSLHFGGTAGGASNPAFPGGLSNRTFRLDPKFDTSDEVVSPTQTTKYTFCAKARETNLCRTIEVTVD